MAPRSGVSWGGTQDAPGEALAAGDGWDADAAVDPTLHTPVLRVQIKLYREPNAMIFNGFFPMVIVNCGTILVAIPQKLDAGTFTQNLENSLTVTELAPAPARTRPHARPHAQEQAQAQAHSHYRSGSRAHSNHKGTPAREV